VSQRVSIFWAALIAFGIAAPAAAQETGGAVISGSFAGAFGEGATNIGAGGSAGYRFTPRFGLNFEALALPDFEVEGSGRSGRGVAFLSHLVAEFPSAVRWLTPYVEGGGGLANIRSSGSFLFDRDGRSMSHGDPRPFLRHDGRSASGTSLALSVGAGVDFNIWRGLSVGPAITYMRLFGGLEDLNLTRIGGKATYRF
jgi:opacity protein-like surface antigen